MDSYSFLLIAFLGVILVNKFIVQVYYFGRIKVKSGWSCSTIKGVQSFGYTALTVAIIPYFSSLQTMDPEQYFVQTHRRLLGGSPSESDMSHQYLSFTLGIAILIVLFCMLLVIMLYNCFWARSDSFLDHQQNLDLHETTPRPATPKEVEAIPVYTYGAMSPCSSSAMSSECESCAICLDEYLTEDTIRVLPRCKHMFHRDCIDQWLLMMSLNCPICRERTNQQCVEDRGICCVNIAGSGNNTFPLWSIANSNNARRPSNI